MLKTVRSISIFALLALLALSTVFPGRAMSAVTQLGGSHPAAVGFYLWVDDDNDGFWDWVDDDNDGTWDPGEGEGPLLGACASLYAEPGLEMPMPSDTFLTWVYDEDNDAWFSWDPDDKDGTFLQWNYDDDTDGWFSWAGDDEDGRRDGVVRWVGAPAGDYTVVVCGAVAQAGYEFSSPPLAEPNHPFDSQVNPAVTPADTNATDTFTLKPEEEKDILGGAFLPGRSIGDTVWKDLNADGIQDPGETGLSGVPVELYTSGYSTPDATTTTGASGLYGFTNLDPGNYYVKFILPSVYFTLQDQGDDDALDSDADPYTGETHVITLGLDPNEDNLTLDAGVIPIAITCGGDLMISGNPEIQGAFGSVHANGDLTISGNPIITQHATAFGIYSVSGNPQIGGIAAGGFPEVPIPPVNPADYRAIADYELSDDGYVDDSNGVNLGYYGSNPFNGWTWGGDKWHFSSDDKFDGTYYIEGDAVVSGNPGSPADPWNVTIVATGSIEISGGPNMQANSSDILLLAGGDLKINGNPDQYFTGDLLAHEQLSISGNPTLVGAITVEDEGNISGLVDKNEISGGMILTYPAP